jgi:hypothetical protein
MADKAGDIPRAKMSAAERRLRSLAVMFLSRLESLNTLEQSRPSRFWRQWLNGPAPSADTVRRVGALLQVEDLRWLLHDLYSRLKRRKALVPPAHGLMAAELLGAIPAATADFFGNMRIARNYPFVFLAYGVAGIAGNYVSGYFKDAAKLSGTGVAAWETPFIIAGVACLVAAVLAALLRPPRKPA